MEMVWNRQSIAYTYDVSGNLTQKALDNLADTYCYDALWNLSGYSGYDG
jgi:hypothetical protein